MTDEHFLETIQAAQAGDESAKLLIWEQVRRYGYAVARRYTGLLTPDTDTDDLQQAVAEATLTAIKATDLTVCESLTQWLTYYALHVHRTVQAQLGIRGAGNDAYRQCGYGEHGCRLQDKLTDDSDTTIQDTIPDPDAERPYQDIDEPTVKQLAELLAADLEGRELDICTRSVLHAERLADIGAEMGISLQRVSDIRKSALRKLRRKWSATYQSLFPLSYDIRVGRNEFNRTHISATEKIAFDHMRKSDRACALMMADPDV